MRGIGQHVDHRACGASQPPGRQVRAVVVALIALEKRDELGDDRPGQFLLGQLFVRGAVEQGDLAGQSQPGCRFLGAVALGALGIEDRLDVGGVVNDLAGVAVAAVLDKVAGLRLGRARRAG